VIAAFPITLYEIHAILRRVSAAVILNSPENQQDNNVAPCGIMIAIVYIV